jgi:hypothetical protein
MGPIGYPKTSVTKNLGPVTSKKSKDLSCTELCHYLTNCTAVISNMSTDELYTPGARCDWPLCSDCCCFVSGEVLIPGFFCCRLLHSSAEEVCPGWRSLSRTPFLFDRSWTSELSLALFIFLRDCSLGSWREGSAHRFASQLQQRSRVVPRFFFGALHMEITAST